MLDIEPFDDSLFAFSEAQWGDLIDPELIHDFVYEEGEN